MNQSRNLKLAYLHLPYWELNEEWRKQRENIILVGCEWELQELKMNHKKVAQPTLTQ